MGKTSEIIVLVKYSPKREQILGALKDQVIFNENEDSDERVDNTCILLPAHFRQL